MLRCVRKTISTSVCCVLIFTIKLYRPGYQLYMDVETVGDYYGENRNEEGILQDSNLYYKMQIIPRYWKLNLDTGVS